MYEKCMYFLKDYFVIILSDYVHTHVV